MPSEWYLQGHKAGMASASANRDVLAYCYNSQEISVLAGEKLQEIEDRENAPWFTHSANWRLGFWTGFCDRADEFRK